MRTRLACLSCLLLVLAAGAGRTAAQISMQPTPPPEQYADNEDWYVSGEPIAYGRGIYHQSGPIVHFHRNEMVMTGAFGAVPIYVRTTEEPGSVIYVPLAGGLVRPYERRRAGDLAGTVGSRPPAFPVVVPSEAAPPGPRYAQVPPELDPAVPQPVGTAGATAAIPEPVSARHVPFRAPGRAVAPTDLFIEYKDARWYVAGPAVEYVPERFTRSGEYHGFPVYTEHGRSDVIHIPLLSGAPGLLTPYRR